MRSISESPRLELADRWNAMDRTERPAFLKTLSPKDQERLFEEIGIDTKRKAAARTVQEHKELKALDTPALLARWKALPWEVRKHWPQEISSLAKEAEEKAREVEKTAEAARAAQVEAQRAETMAADWASIQPDLPGIIQEWLARIGIAPIELQATPERVTREIRAKLPTEAVQTLCEGYIPPRGFGLSGPAGCGKTFCLAALLRRYSEALAQQEGPKRGRSLPNLTPALWIQWISWPETVAQIKGTVGRREGNQEVENLVQRLMEVQMLILDDLGAERIKGSYQDDWGAAHLDRIIDHRHRHGLPLFFTTNLNRTDLFDRYGARMFSRLGSIAPLIELPSSLVDRRL